jgi:hypothetical protein
MSVIAFPTSVQFGPNFRVIAAASSCTLVIGFLVVMNCGVGPVMITTARGAMRSVPRPTPGITKSNGIAQLPNRSSVYISVWRTAAL